METTIDPQQAAGLEEGVPTTSQKASSPSNFRAIATTRRGLGWKHFVFAFGQAILVLLAVQGIYFSPWWYSHSAGGSSRYDIVIRRELSLKDRVDKVLSKFGVIDGHNDLPIVIRTFYNNHIYTSNFTFDTPPGLVWHVDLPRLQQGRVGGQFWSVYVECPANDTDENGVEFGDGLYAKAVHDTLQQIDVVKRLAKKYPEAFKFVGSPYEVERWRDEIDASRLAWEEEEGLEDMREYRQIVSMIGVEGLHQIGNSASTLRLYYELGARYFTLTHVCNNKYADGAGVQKPRWGGLSEDGRKMVREMNRLGMIVDLSHVTADVMKDVLGGASRAPVMFSHSSAYALCPHQRNVPDDVLHMVKQNNGIVMVNFYPEFISCGEGKKPEDADLSMVADHIEHIGKLIGWEHVGIGSDFDGILTVPKGLEDVSKYPALFEELLKRNVTEKQLAMVAYENILRVWKGVVKVSEEMEREGVLPLEDDVQSL